MRTTTAVAEVALRWCATCVEETLFEQPDCPDHTRGECPEWVCVACGEALLLGFAPPRGRVVRRRRTPAA